MKEHNYECNIVSCEYNDKEKCEYCGDYYKLNSKDCIAYIDKDEE